MTQTLFITGADRGIGLEFVKQYASEGWRILATYRGPQISDTLQELVQSHSHVNLFQLDVNDYSRLKTLSQALVHEQVDILINNAGILYPSLFGNYDRTIFEDIYRTNAIAPLMICEAFYPLLEFKKGAMISISSKTASIGGDATEDMIAYRMSKAALNMAMREVSRKLSPKGIQVLLLAPGYVKTAMSPRATLEASESVALMRQVIARRLELESGGFYDRYGKPIQW